jgi:GLPGLI family protein
MKAMRIFNLVSLFLALSFSGYCQKLEVIYAQLDKSIDTSFQKPISLDLRGDTTAKWVYRYANGLSIFRQTPDSPEENVVMVKNLKTGNIDKLTSVNMSKKNMHFIDYSTRKVTDISHFFDIEYAIEDSLQNYKWKFIDDKKVILDHPCKRAMAKHPFDKNVLYDVWYATDLPNVGQPVGFNGLPGLILRIDRNGKPLYQALSIRHLPADEPMVIERPISSAKPITYAEYYKVKFGVPFVNHNKQPPPRKSHN